MVFIAPGDGVHGDAYRVALLEGKSAGVRDGDRGVGSLQTWRERSE